MTSFVQPPSARAAGASLQGTVSEVTFSGCRAPEGMSAGGAARRALLVLSAIEGALVLARARRDLIPLRAVRDELAALAPHGAGVL